MIITIDGPAGTGKSTVAQTVADVLGFDFLDTGAMYRAIGFEVLRRNAPLDNPREIAFIAAHCRIEFDYATKPPGVILNDQPVGHFLRAKDISSAASFVAVVPKVRDLMVHQQQAIGRARPNIVTEGRDQGTVVFPEARLKFFLTASADERAHRRARQLSARGENVEYAEILKDIVARDYRDTHRAVGPLRPSDDAIKIDTTHLSLQEVAKQIIAQARDLKNLYNELNQQPDPSKPDPDASAHQNSSELRA